MWTAFSLLLFGVGVLVLVGLKAGCAQPYCRDLTKELRSYFTDNGATLRRQRLAEIEADRSRYDVVMLGDSITEGGPWSKFAANGVSVANQGISGDTSSDVLRRIALTNRAAPRRIFIMIGVNDILRGAEPGLLDRVEEILVQLSRHDRRIYLQSILLTGLDNGSLNPTISIANEGLRGLCRARPGCTFVDVNASLARGGRLRRDVTTDGLHLNRLGYEEWGALIGAAVSEPDVQP